MDWLGKPVIPGYGCLGRSTLGRAYLEEDLAGERINKKLNQLMYMVDRNQV